MGWIEHGDAGYIEMKNRDIADLRAKVAALEAERKPKCPDCNSVRMSHCSDPQNCGGVYWPDSYYRKLEAENGRLKAALTGIYDKWENGTSVQEADEDGSLVDGTSLGNAVKLSFAEEQTILNLIVDKPETFEQACANCGKPYRAHLLHDRNRCGPDADAAWFPQSVATAIIGAQQQNPAQDKEQG